MASYKPNHAVCDLERSYGSFESAIQTSRLEKSFSWSLVYGEVFAFAFGAVNKSVGYSVVVFH
jgi:hypothetical protein